jgi:hypothetical protein
MGSLGRLSMCLALCEGAWCIKALRMALLSAEPSVVRTIVAHPEFPTAMEDDDSWKWCMEDCGRRRRRDGVAAIFPFIANAGTNDHTRRLPWRALAMAAEVGNAAFVRVFLAHPRCPTMRTHPDAVACTLPIVTAPRSARLANRWRIHIIKQIPNDASP